MAKNTAPADGGGNKDDATKTPKTNASLKSDIIKTATPKIAKIVAGWILNKIPAGSTLDQVLAKYSNYWDEITWAVQLLILQFTNAPDIIDDALAAIRYEVVCMIKDRYANGVKTDFVSKEGCPLIGDIIGLLKPDDLTKLMGLISNKDQTAVVKFLKHSFGQNESLTLKTLDNLAQLSQPVFDVYFDSNFPKTVSVKPINIREIFQKISGNEEVKKVVDFLGTQSEKAATQVKRINDSYVEACRRPSLIERVEKATDIVGFLKRKLKKN